MKRNVKKIALFVMMTCLFFASTKVKAYFNGDGGINSGIDYGGSCPSNAICNYNNIGTYLQIRLYYIPESGSWKQIGGTYYVAGDNSNGAENLINFGIPSENIIRVSGLNGINPKTDKEAYKKASKILRQYFGDNEEPINAVANKNLRSFLQKAAGNDYESKLTNDTDFANTKATKVSEGAKQGYRIIIEPALLYITSGQSFIISSKGVASRMNDASFISKYGNNWYIDNNPVTKEYANSVGSSNSPQSQWLYTNFADVGISKTSQSECEKIGTKAFANIKNGCGYNIIDVGKFINNSCYAKNVTGNLTCEKYDANNETTFTETYTKIDHCDKTQMEENKNYSEYGKKISENNSCTLYCIESANASLPGGITRNSLLGRKININSYFAWPAIKGQGMDMKLSSTLKCTVVAKNGKSCSDSDAQTLANAASGKLDGLSFGGKVTGGNFNPLNASNLVVYDTSKTEIGTVKVKEAFEVTKTAYLKINKNSNRYFSRENGKITKVSDSSFTNAFDRGQGVISVKDLEYGNDYDLKISDVKLGDGNEFGKRITNYVCHYTPEPPCVCPEGTNKAGTDLANKKIQEGMSCAEAIEKYCNTCECDEDSIPEKHHMLLTDEIISTTECDKLKKAKCYVDCTTESGTKVDTSACVTEKMQKDGKKLSEAANDCAEQYCPKTYCYVLGEKIDLKDCLNSGKKYRQCYYDYCDVEYKCDHATEQCYYCKTTSGGKKDISSCVASEVAKNKKTINQAITICTNRQPECNNQGKGDCVKNCKWHKVTSGKYTSYELKCSDSKVACDIIGPMYCPDKKCSKIVYRTIDLNNPFPGKNGKGETKDYSNGGTGRYPNSNWNSKETVSKKILNARGVKGEELYKQKPLYTIVLTPESIKKIRKEYSKSYSDFTLNCFGSNETSACVSSFLHDGKYVKMTVNNEACGKLVGNNTGENERAIVESAFKSCYESNN